VCDKYVLLWGWIPSCHPDNLLQNNPDILQHLSTFVFTFPRDVHERFWFSGRGSLLDLFVGPSWGETITKEIISSVLLRLPSGSTYTSLPRAARLYRPRFVFGPRGWGCMLFGSLKREIWLIWLLWLMCVFGAWLTVREFIFTSLGVFAFPLASNLLPPDGKASLSFFKLIHHTRCAPPRARGRDAGGPKRRLFIL